MQYDTDWNKVKNEYITTTISYRSLSSKYGLSMRTLTTHARVEKWTELRAKYEDKATTRCLTVAVRTASARIERIVTQSDRILDAVTKVLDNIDSIVLKRKIKKEFTEVDSETGVVTGITVNDEEAIIQQGIIDITTLKQLSEVLKNIREIQMLRSDMDVREQEARIKKLEADAAKSVGDDDTESTGVLILPSIIQREEEDGEGKEVSQGSNQDGSKNGQEVIL